MPAALFAGLVVLAAVSCDDDSTSSTTGAGGAGGCADCVPCGFFVDGEKCATEGDECPFADVNCQAIITCKNGIWEMGQCMQVSTSTGGAGGDGGAAGAGGVGGGS